MQDYTFFGYPSNEALHLSERERKIIFDCFPKIGYELEHSIDKYSKKLIVSNIEMFLDYCIRFYDRQFITREKPHKGIIERFEELLNDYFQADKPQNFGLPSVAYFAQQVNLSPSYFGDIVKRKPARQHRNISNGK